MKLKGLNFANDAEIHEAVTDELKKVRKEEFSAAFQKLYDRAEACTYTDGACSELKKKRCLPHVFDFKKKSVLLLLDRTVYISTGRHHRRLKPSGHGIMWNTNIHALCGIQSRDSSVRSA